MCDKYLTMIDLSCATQDQPICGTAVQYRHVFRDQPPSTTLHIANHDVVLYQRMCYYMRHVLSYSCSTVQSLVHTIQNVEDHASCSICSCVNSITYTLCDPLLTNARQTLVQDQLVMFHKYKAICSVRKKACTCDPSWHPTDSELYLLSECSDEVTYFERYTCAASAGPTSTVKLISATWAVAVVT